MFCQWERNSLYFVPTPSLNNFFSILLLYLDLKVLFLPLFQLVRGVGIVDGGLVGRRRAPLFLGLPLLSVGSGARQGWRRRCRSRRQRPGRDVVAGGPVVGGRGRVDGKYVVASEKKQTNKQ